MNAKIAPPFRFIFFILITAFSLHSCVSARDKSIKEWEKHEWHIIKTDQKEQPTWIIYTRKIANTNFLEYKIEGDIQASSKACLAAFRKDLYKQADDPKNAKYPTYEISKEKDGSLLTYVIHNEPFPLKDTEMSVRYQFFNEEDGTAEVRWHEAWMDSPVQPSKKLNRVEAFRGSWHFSPAAESSCHAMNSVQFDPKKMPLWLVEPMVFKFLREGLEDLRTTTSK